MTSSFNVPDFDCGMELEPKFGGMGAPRYTGLIALASLLKKVKYKQGWAFGVKVLPSPPSFMDPYAPRHALVITYLAPDAYNPGRPKEQLFQVTLPNDPIAHEADEIAWIHWLFRVIVYLEEHEAAEFLLVNGQRPFNPHAKEFRSIVGIPNYVA